MMQNLLFAATVIAFMSLLVFVVTYARLPWHTTPLGRAVMGSALAVWLLAAVGLGRRIDQQWPEVGLSHTLTGGAAFAYLVVAAVWIIKTRVVLEGDPRRRRRRKRRPSP